MLLQSTSEADKRGRIFRRLRHDKALGAWEGETRQTIGTNREIRRGTSFE